MPRPPLNQVINNDKCVLTDSSRLSSLLLRTQEKHYGVCVCVCLFVYTFVFVYANYVVFVYTCVCVCVSRAKLWRAARDLGSFQENRKQRLVTAEREAQRAVSWNQTPKRREPRSLTSRPKQKPVLLLLLQPTARTQ